VKFSGPSPRLCIGCRGRGYCGLRYCPPLVVARASLSLTKTKTSRELFGPTPPSVFVGWRGYPRVRAGPSIPISDGDPRLYDKPEDWVNMSLNRLLEMRLSMVTGFGTLDVRRTNDRLAWRLREAVLSEKPVDIEMRLHKPVRPRIRLSDNEPPMGPWAPVEYVRIADNPKVPKPVERLAESDVPAVDAVKELYVRGIPVSSIQKLFSVGVLGRRRDRRLVPTRWSITAVDDIISSQLIQMIKGYREIGDFEIYYRRWQDNVFMAILVPGKWSYEWMEAWWPGSTWNPMGAEVEVEGDYEGYTGRRGYPVIGGCYYAARLAVAEHLHRMRRQATAVLLREIYPGFRIPVGVWYVRENVRAMLGMGPMARAPSLDEALEWVDRLTVLGSGVWSRRSRILSHLLRGRRITDYMVGLRR